MTLTITEFEQFMDDYEAVEHFRLLAGDLGLQSAELAAITTRDIAEFFTELKDQDINQMAFDTAFAAAHAYNNYISLCKEL